MSRRTASSEIKMATTGCPKSSNVVGWMPVLLLSHKAAVACKVWEACKWLVWAATAEAHIKHKPTQALPEAAPCCCMQSKTAVELPTPFSELPFPRSPNAEKISPNGENTELSQDPSLPTEYKSNFPLLALNTCPAKVCTVQVTATFFGVSYP